MGTLGSKEVRLAMSVHGAADAIRRAALAWPGVTAQSHRFGGTEFRLGRREVGHIHGDSLADIPFPRRVRDELVTAGEALPHHVLPESGWVSVPMKTPADVERVIELLRRSYDLAVTQRARAQA